MEPVECQNCHRINMYDAKRCWCCWMKPENYDCMEDGPYPSEVRERQLNVLLMRLFHEVRIREHNQRSLCDAIQIVEDYLQQCERELPPRRQ